MSIIPDSQNLLTQMASDALQITRLRAELERATVRVGELEAERGVILNGYAMIANHALPYFKKLDKKNPTHDTAELLSACYGALEKRTEETNNLAVEWMNTMRSENSQLRAQLAAAAPLRDAAREQMERDCAAVCVFCASSEYREAQYDRTLNTFTHVRAGGDYKEKLCSAAPIRAAFDALAHPAPGESEMTK